MLIKVGNVAIENKCFNPLVPSHWNFNTIQWLRPLIVSVIVFGLCSLVYLNDLGPVSSIEGAFLIIIMTLPVLIIWNLGFVTSVKQSMSYGEMRKNGSKSNNILDVLNMKTLDNELCSDPSEPLISNSESESLESINSDSSSFIVNIGWKRKLILLCMLSCGVLTCGFGVYQCFVS